MSAVLERIPSLPLQGATPRIGLESPLALFAPEHLLETPLPAPLYLLEYIPASLKLSYEVGEDGRLLHAEDVHRVHTLLHEDGRRMQVELQGGQTVGLPTQRDVDYILGLLKIADEGGAAEDGTIRDPSFSAIIRATGFSGSIGQPQIDPAKLALERWAKLTVTTRTAIEFTREAQRVRLEGSYPLAPDGYPDLLERNATHNVLVYEWESEVRGRSTADRIRLLRLNPLWLNQSAVGLTAWICVETHAGLRSWIARRIYQILALRLARGGQAPFAWSLETLQEMLGHASEQKPSKVLRSLKSSLDSLVEAGVIASYETPAAGRGSYEVRIEPGEKLRAAARLRGVGSADPATTRALLWHLQRYRIAIPTGRSLLRTQPAQVRSALRRALYLQTEKRGRDGAKPIQSWSGWILKAVEQNWQFAEPEYLAWLERMSAQALHGVRASLPAAPSSAPAAPQTMPSAPPVREVVLAEPQESPSAASSPTLNLPAPDTAWGRALERLGGEFHSSQLHWFQGSEQETLSEEELVVRMPSAFALEWVGRWRSELEQALEASEGRALRLKLVHH